jgi:phosphate transport system permease protein
MKIEENIQPPPLVEKKTTAGVLSKLDVNIALVPGVTFILALLAALTGALGFVTNRFDYLQIPLLLGMVISLQILFLDVYRSRQRWDVKIALLSLLSFAFIMALRALPEFITGWRLNAVIDRAVIAGIFLLASAVMAMSVSLFYLLGATPQAEDYSRYPLILTPIALTLAVYFSLLFRLFADGLQRFNLQVILSPYYYILVPVKTFIAGDWPKWTAEMTSSVGLLNYVLGTLLLMLLTSLFSLPFGMGTGIYLSEYSHNRFGGVVRFMVTSLRAISLLILGMMAYTLSNIGNGTPLEGILRGTFFSGYETRLSSGGSFFTASIMLSLLVIPIIARATEEGCRSLPNELREGSFALGASEDTTLKRVVLPWALPNIVTGLLLGCAEAAGSTAVLLFIAGRGDYGVGVFKQVTSLAFMIFEAYYGEKLYKGAMGPYQFTAGMLLVIITVGMGILAMVLKRWLVKRHRGG